MSTYKFEVRSRGKVLENYLEDDVTKNIASFLNKSSEKISRHLLGGTDQLVAVLSSHEDALSLSEKLTGHGLDSYITGPGYDSDGNPEGEGISWLKWLGIVAALGILCAGGVYYYLNVYQGG